MVSSLPFLAHVFVRKAREYRSKMSKDSKGSTSDGANNSGHRMGSSSREMYKVGPSKKPTYSSKVTETDPNSSEELVLQGAHGDFNIVKSMSYSVRVDEEMGRPGSKNGFRFS